ncbi:MAG: hypothetical protein ABIB79_03545 [archaeon]
MNFNQLIDSKIPEVTEYARCKMAHVLFEHVHWEGEGSRYDVDGDTAREWIEERMESDTMRNITGLVVRNSLYSRLREKTPGLKKIPTYERGFFPSNEAAERQRFMEQNYDVEYLTELFESMSEETWHGDIDLFGGRVCFENCKTMARKRFLWNKDRGYGDLKDGYLVFSKPKPYTSI